MERKHFDEAFVKAKKRFDRTDPTERDGGFERYLIEQLQSDKARRSGPGEYHDPLAD